MQHLSEQEIVRRESLNALKELGVDPFPAEKFDVNFRSSDFTSAQFKNQLAGAIEDIEGFDHEKAGQLRDLMLQNKFRISQLMEKEEFKGMSRDY